MYVCTRLPRSGPSWMQVKGNCLSFHLSYVTLDLLYLQLQELHIYLATDGFEVSDEEYFQSLPAQTLFVVAGPDAVITTGKCDL